MSKYNILCALHIPPLLVIPVFCCDFTFASYNLAINSKWMGYAKVKDISKETSFGYKKELFHLNENPTIEIITFLREGREHKHDVFETFVVLEGSGIVYSGEQSILVSVGDIITIPPNTIHWMEPEQGGTLSGFLWYHDTQCRYHCS